MIDITNLSKWLPYNAEINPNAKINLFCFSFAGGTATTYRSWVAEMGDNINLLPVQLPGRERRLNEAPFYKLDALIDALEYFFTPLMSEMPFAFFGHSMGTKLAFELTNTIKSKGLAPEHLFVSGAPAPDSLDRAPVLYNLDNDDFIRELKRLNGTPDEVLANKELMNLMIPFIKADYTINDNYKYIDRGPLKCKITAFGGTEDPDVNEFDLRAWGRHTINEFKYTMYSGDHFFLLPHKNAIIKEIIDTLNY
jgi:medium-chain acyl-[acyl-carrier-protein] hydrolase